MLGKEAVAAYMQAAHSKREHIKNFKKKTSIEGGRNVPPRRKSAVTGRHNKMTVRTSGVVLSQAWDMTKHGI